MKPCLIARILVVAGVCLSVGACSMAEDPTLALRDVTVVDVAGGSLNPKQTVLIADDRIVAVGPLDQRNVPNGIEVVEAAGDFLIPGLIDMHVHTLWQPSVPPTFLPLFVANGVTTVRDMGGTLELLREHRRTVADRVFPSPRVIAAGAILDGPDPVHPEVSIPISTADEAIAAVDSVAAAGADFVKVYTLLCRSAFDGLLAAAEGGRARTNSARRGRPVAGGH